MANILIVHAHPEPRSFSSALARTAAETFAHTGHEVEVSDLYAMSFDPVSSRRNFVTVADRQYFKPQVEELHATEHDGFVPELAVEMRKLEACDLLVFSFPLWWFGLPAILKGWIDRVFAYGRIYGQGRWYDHGVGEGKRALVLMTTGSPAPAFGPIGLHASLESILFPVHHGVFGFNGFAPLQPFVTWGAAHLSLAARKESLQALRGRLATVWSEPVTTVPLASDYEPGTWVDRVPRLLIIARKKAPGGFSGDLPSKRDLEVLREWRQARRLVRAMFARPGSLDWQAALELRANDAGEAMAWLRALPMGTHCEFSCMALDSRNEDAISPFWSPDVG